MLPCPCCLCIPFFCTRHRVLQEALLCHSLVHSVHYAAERNTGNRTRNTRIERIKRDCKPIAATLKGERSRTQMTRIKRIKRDCKPIAATLKGERNRSRMTQIERIKRDCKPIAATLKGERNRS